MNVINGIDKYTQEVQYDDAYYSISVQEWVEREFVEQETPDGIAIDDEIEVEPEQAWVNLSAIVSFLGFTPMVEDDTVFWEREKSTAPVIINDRKL